MTLAQPDLLDHIEPSSADRESYHSHQKLTNCDQCIAKPNMKFTIRVAKEYTDQKSDCDAKNRQRNQDSEDECAPNWPKGWQGC